MFQEDTETAAGFPRGKRTRARRHAGLVPLPRLCSSSLDSRDPLELAMHCRRSTIPAGTACIHPCCGRLSRSRTFQGRTAAESKRLQGSTRRADIDPRCLGQLGWTASTVTCKSSPRRRDPRELRGPGSHSTVRPGNRGSLSWSGRQWHCKRFPRGMVRDGLSLGCRNGRQGRPPE